MELQVVEPLVALLDTAPRVAATALCSFCKRNDFEKDVAVKDAARQAMVQLGALPKLVGLIAASNGATALAALHLVQGLMSGSEQAARTTMQDLVGLKLLPKLN